MVAVSVRALTKVFHDDVVAVDHIDLEIASGEFFVLYGAVGSGKTTLLRLLAGVEEPTEGDVLIDGVPVRDLPGREHRVTIVFQSYSLYPHLTVAQNIGFPLRTGSEPVPDVADRVADAAWHLGIGDLLGRVPAHLSTGQRQRVALARAIVRQPSVLLLDEPLSNVSPKIWAELRGEIVELTKRLGITTVYVAHDPEEARRVGDRIAVLRHGKVTRIGTASEIAL